MYDTKKAGKWFVEVLEVSEPIGLIATNMESGLTVRGDFGTETLYRYSNMTENDARAYFAQSKAQGDKCRMGDGTIELDSSRWIDDDD